MASTVRNWIEYCFNSLQIMDKSMSQSMEFKELTKKDAQLSLAHELEKLKKTGNI